MRSHSDAENELIEKEKEKMKKTMKKVMAMAMILVLSMMLLAGCGNDNTQADGDKVFKVGILQLMEHPSLNTIRESIVEGLADAGYVDGENLEIDYQNGSNTHF